jgi:purine-binding chemotaxis protein CheW
MDDHKHRVLLERARLLSAPEEGRTEESSDRILVFRSGGDRRAVLLSEVAEVIGHARRTLVPGAPPHVAGLIQLRGEVRPVYRLDQLLGTDVKSTDASDFVLLLRSGVREFAILADEVEGVREVRASTRKPAPAGAAYACWATEDHVAVLDVASLVKRKR